MPRFAFNVLAELDDSYVKFPSRLADTKITDEMIADYLHDSWNMLRPRDTADKVEKLMLLVAAIDFDDAYTEYLDPYKFWPVCETRTHSQLRDACRA